MAFDGSEGKVVTLTEASDWTSRFRGTITPGDTLGHFFGYEKINLILAQEGCMGIRIYYGLEEDMQKNLVLVGVDAEQNDMENGVIVEKAIKCPPLCGNGSKLNS